MDGKSDQKKKVTVCIVGPNNFRNQLLVSFLEEEKDPGLEYVCRRKISEVLGDIPERDLLFMLDCLNRDPFDKSGDFNILLPFRSLTDFPVCLLNMPQGTGNEKKLLRYGIRGIFFSDSPYKLIRRGIPAILAGELWYPRDILSACALKNSRPKNGYRKNAAILTSREKKILGKLTSGASNKSIASDLCISHHTVKTHLYNIFRKIEVKNRVEASLWAKENL